MLSEETRSIQDDVRFSSGGFSTTEKLGSFINNRKFSDGYVRYLNGEDDTKSYLWEALSAIGDDLGDAVYGNVLNYVDKVSNVETCKIQALDSMMREIGFEYGVFDAVKRFPYGIVDMMDVFSIDRKYVVGGELLSEGLRNRLSGTSAVYQLSSESDREGYAASSFTPSASVDHSLDTTVVD